MESEISLTFKNPTVEYNGNSEHWREQFLSISLPHIENEDEDEINQYILGFSFEKSFGEIEIFSTEECELSYDEEHFRKIASKQRLKRGQKSLIQ